MKDWPLGDGKYLPIDAAEFERLAAAMKPRAEKAPPIPPAAIVAARYEAKLVGDRLTGHATLDVTLVGADARDVAVRTLQHGDPKSGVGHERLPSPKGRGDRPPALGSGSDGRLGAMVERSGRLNLEWSLAGHRDSSDAVDFSFELPPAPANRLFVELPNGLSPTVDQGLILGSEPVGEASRRWRIELGGHGSFQLSVVSDGEARQRRQLALLRESRTYDCSLRGVEVSAQWKLQVYNEPLRQVAVLLDPGLQLVSARLGDAAIPWSAAPAADGTRSESLRLPEPIRDTDRVIRLGAIGRPVFDKPWRLPRIRAEGLLWQEGSLSLLTPEPIDVDRITVQHCAQTGTGPLSAPRTGQSMQFQSFDPDATVEVVLSRRPANVAMLAAQTIALDGDEATARVAAQFRISGGASSAIEADVARRAGSSTRSIRFPPAEWPIGRHSGVRMAANVCPFAWPPRSRHNVRCNWRSRAGGLSRVRWSVWESTILRRSVFAA